MSCTIVGLPSASLDELFEEILNPSGIWADYNPVHDLWEKIIALSMVVPMTCVPDEPNPDDYPDLTSPRSPIWPERLLAH